MSRFWGKLAGALTAACLLAAPAATAQGFSGLARVNPGESRVTDTRGGGAEVILSLSQGVPYRIFTLDEPPRLVLDFQEASWTGLSVADFLQGENIASAHFGTYVPGWSRMVLQLAAPMAVDTAALDIDAETAAARLNLRLSPVSAAQFAAAAGAPQDARWDLPAAETLGAKVPRDPDAPLLVVLDPGHGGIDPGAEAGGGIEEKDLMLGFARELSDVLVRSGQFRVKLTRNDDYFVSLERRVAMAHQLGADLFISLHADSLSEGHAHGSTVYTLSKEASDVASAKLAERHDRADLLAGTDLSKADDQVTGVMLDLARQETYPRSLSLAAAIAGELEESGVPMHRRPLRSAGFSVLKSAGIPSVLIELGFMSSPRDLENLLNPEWRATMSRSILAGLIAWRVADDAQKSLVRQ